MKLTSRRVLIPAGSILVLLSLPFIFYDNARHWNATAEEIDARYPCDGYLTVPYDGYVRAIDIQAPREVVFRWLCQLKVAPYSYDWIDNGGRRSPRTLTPGLDHLARGQRILIFRIVDFKKDEHISAAILPEMEASFGKVVLSFMVRSTGPATSRLVVKMDVPAVSAGHKVQRIFLSWGNLMMTRKQFYTLKELAEEQAAGS